MGKINFKQGAAGWLIPIIIVILGLVGIMYLANQSKPNIGSENDILTMRDGDWVRGPSNAKVTLIEFGDFQCPACGAYFPLVLQLEQKFPNDLAVIFREFPLTGHKNAMNAARAAEAAGLQGKFWEMHDKLYGTQEDWSASDSAAAIFHGYAEGLGLDVAKFDQDFASDVVGKAIDSDRLEGLKVGINSTPTFYINGQKLADNPRSLEAFEQLIKDAIAGAASTPAATSTPAYHGHADILVTLSGKTIDFSQAQYQSTEGKELDEYIHFHNNNGKVVHFHKDGKTLKDFLAAVGYKVEHMTESPGRHRLVAANGEKWSEGGDIMFKLAVNGTTIAGDPFDYVFKDLDRAYFQFGPLGTKDELAAFEAKAKTISNDACIYSEKCPERGPAPKEECVGGLGTTCAEPQD